MVIVLVHDDDKKAAFDIQIPQKVSNRFIIHVLFTVIQIITLVYNQYTNRIKSIHGN